MWFDLSGDFKTAFRAITRAPGTSSLIVATLALAIGAATIGFAFADLALFRGLPVDDHSRVVSVFASDTRGSNPRARVSAPDYLDYQARSKTLERISVFRDGRAALIENGQSRTLNVTYATADLFASMGQPAVAGRAFAPGDDAPGAAPVAVLSHRYWQQEMRGRADAVGRTMRIGRENFTIIGVITPALEFGNLAEVDAWLPFRPDPNSARDARNLRLVARLAPGVSFEQAAAEIAAIGDALGSEYPLTNGGWKVRLIPIRDLTGGEGFWVVVALFLLSIALLMAIATANVSNLIMVRAVARQRELAVRTALGARGSRLLRQFLTEGLVLSAGAAALSLPLTLAGIQVIGMMSAEPIFHQLWIDSHEFGFIALLTLVCPLVFCLASARAIARPDLRHTLAAGGTRGATASTRGRGVLVIAQVSLAVVLLTTSLLAARSMQRIYAAPIGMATAELLLFSLAFDDVQYPSTPQAGSAALAVRDALAALPGVQVVSMFQPLPILGGEAMTAFTIDGAKGGSGAPTPTASMLEASEGASATLGLSLLAGQWWAGGQTDVAVVGREAALRYFGGVEAALDRQLVFSRADQKRSARVIGVVSDVASADRTGPPPARIWTPIDPETRRRTFVLKAAAPAALTSQVRQVIADTAPGVPIEGLSTLDDALERAASSDYLVTGILAAFAIVAVILAATGLFGLVSFTVSQRTAEFGTRMALGASAWDVIRLVARQSLRLAVVGLTVGLAGGVGVGLTMGSVLYGTSPADPATLIGVAGLLTVVSLVATALPAWRASRIDPVMALRAD